MKKNLLNLLDNIQEHGEETPQSERYLLIDGLNLFFFEILVQSMQLIQTESI